MGESEKSKARRAVRWWHVVIGILSPFVCLAIAHAIWSWREYHLFEQRISEIQANGEPILPADFAKLEPKTGQNGAPLLRAAALIVDDESPQRATIGWAPTTLPAPPEAWPYLDEALEWYQPALRRIDLALAKPQCQWHHDVASPVISMLLPELSQARDLANLLLIACHVEHHRGHDAAMILHMQHLLALGTTIEYTPAYIGHAVALGISASAAAHIEQIAPELHIGKKEDASPGAIRELIGRLLDEAPVREGLRFAFLAERMSAIDIWTSFAHGQIGDSRNAEPLVGYASSPLCYSNAIAMLDRVTGALVAASATDYPAARSRLDSAPPLGRVFLYADALDPTDQLRHLVKAHFEALADRRMAAIALGIRLYRYDHHGVLPDRLEQLVPDYLPAVPLDPMAWDNRPMAYLPRHEHPILYSVGENGVDDGGSEAAMPGVYGEIGEWRRLDRVFYLNRHERVRINIPSPGQNPGPLPGLNFDDRAPWELEHK